MKLQSVYLFPIILFLICIFIQNQINIVNTNITILVKLASVMLILFYGFIDIKYGFICCLGIIIYFNFYNKLSEGFEYDSIPSIKNNEDENIQNDLTNSYTELSISQGSNEIPKIIIQTWKNNNIPTKYIPLINSIKQLNPSYKYLFFTDSQIETFLQKEYPEYYNTYIKLPIKIQKIDFFRYIAVYHYGGFYFDLDMKGIKPLDDYLLNKITIFPVDEHINNSMCNNLRYKYYCNNNNMFLLGQYAFASTTNNVFIKLLIDNIHNNINQIVNMYKSNYNNYENYVYNTTGPDYVTTQYLNYNNKNEITILKFKHRQYFGRYAKHMFFGSWK